MLACKSDVLLHKQVTGLQRCVENEHKEKKSIGIYNRNPVTFDVADPARNCRFSSYSGYGR